MTKKILNNWVPLTLGGLAAGGGLMVQAGVRNALQSMGLGQISVLGTLLLSMGLVGFILLLFVVGWAAHKRPQAVGSEGMVGRIGRVRGPFTADATSYTGLVHVFGALWQAQADEPLPRGTRVLVQEVDGLILQVKKID